MSASDDAFVRIVELVQEVIRLKDLNREMVEALNSVCKGLCDHNYHTAVGLCKDCIVQNAIKKAEGVQGNELF